MTKEQFYEQMPIIIDTEYTTYSCGVIKAHEMVWESIYQAFKARMDSEAGKK